MYLSEARDPKGYGVGCGGNKSCSRNQKITHIHEFQTLKLILLREKLN